MHGDTAVDRLIRQVAYLAEKEHDSPSQKHDRQGLAIEKGVANMARKHCIRGNWKQIGWSIMGVGILSCGAGHRTQHPGYLPFTGPVRVRMESPRQATEDFKYPTSPPSKEQSHSPMSKTTTTNSIKQTSISVSSGQDQPPSEVLSPQSLNQRTYEFFQEDWAPDILNESSENDIVKLATFLRFFQTTQPQNSPAGNTPATKQIQKTPESTPVSRPALSDSTEGTPTPTLKE